MENKRLDYLDNIRWITVVLVIIYHIILYICLIIVE